MHAVLLNLQRPTCIDALFCSRIKKQAPVPGIQQQMECTTNCGYCHQQSSKAQAALSDALQLIVKAACLRDSFSCSTLPILSDILQCD